MAASDYRLLLAAETGAEAFVRRALELLTADVRELALLALTEWQQAGIATPELLPSLAALQNPMWGTWNGLLQVILEARQRTLATGAAAEREKAGRSAALAALADLWHHNLDDAPGGGAVGGGGVSFGKCVEQAIQTGMRAEMERNWEEARRDLRPLLTFMAGDPLAALHASMPGNAAAPPSNAGVSPAAHVTTPAFSVLLGRPDLPQRDLQRLLERHAPEDSPGILLGDFLVGRPVGEGGFGTVHIARQVSTGRKVAVKLLHDGMPAEIRARFQREAAYLARFNHPHIVGVLAYGQARWVAPPKGDAATEPWMETFTRSAPEKTFIAMEWIEGQTLEAIFRQSKSDPTSRRDVRTLAEWFAQAAKALQAVHAANLVHRDIKPSNLMVTPEGIIKLMDFGIARVQEDERTLVTATGRVFGTVVYMSPEQIRAAEAESLVGPGTDIYSLCATFYELFTLTRLYQHDTQSVETVKTRKLTGQRPSPPRAQVRDLPWEIEVILLGGLEAEVADRYRSMDDLERDLRHFLRDEPIEYRRPSPARRLRLGYRRHHAVANVLAASILLAVAGTCLYIHSLHQEQARTARIARENRQRLAASYEEQGRQELLAGQPLRAAVYLSQAYSMDRQSPALRFMLTQALRAVPAHMPVSQGHTKGVYTAEYNADGTKVVTAGRDGLVKIWDAATGKVITLELSPTHEVSGAMFNPAGTRVVAGDDGGNAAVWDALTGQKIFDLKGHTQKVYTPRFSPEGTSIITACDDGKARLWNAATGELIHELPHKGPVLCAFFNKDSTRIITGSQDGSAVIWDARTFDKLHVLAATQAITRAVFSPDGTKAAVSCADPFSTVKLYDAATGQRLQVFLPGHTDIIRRCIFSPDGNKLVTSSLDGTARLWNLATVESVVLPHDGWVFSSAFSHDGRLVGTASRDAIVKLWDAGTGSYVRQLAGHTGYVYQLVFSPDDRRVLTASEDGTARIWDVSSGEVVRTLNGQTEDASANADPLLRTIRENSAVTYAAFDPTGKGVLSICDIPGFYPVDGGDSTLVASMTGRATAGACSPDGKSIAAVDDTRGVIVLNLYTGDQRMARLDPLTPLEPNVKPALNCVRFSPDGRRVVVGGTSGSWLLDAATLQTLRTLPQGPGRADVLHCEFSPDGRLVVTAGADGTAKIWDAATGDMKPLPHKSDVNWAAFSPDGRTVVTASNDADAAVWDVATGQRLRTLNDGNKDYVLMAAFSPDGRRIVTADRDYTARVWDAATGTRIATMEGHAGKVVCANFSPDGSLVVTASEDGKAMLWDAATGKALAVLRGHVYNVRWAEFSSDGSRVLTASEDKTLKIWNTQLETRTPAQIADLVSRRIPWRLEGERLVPVTLNAAAW